MADKKPAIGVLSTLALLKVNFDESRDHIGMFLPFVLDAIASHGAKVFVSQDIADKLSSTFGIAIPPSTVGTLLKRAVSKGYLRRDYGRYFVIEDKFPDTDLVAAAEKLKSSQLVLATSFGEYAKRQGVDVPDAESALASILEFLERNHVALLLDETVSDPGNLVSEPVVDRTQRLVARFIRDEASKSSQLKEPLAQIVEGYVLQKTLLLKDIGTASRKFKRLRMFIDTRIVLQLLGYQGSAARAASSQMISLLKRSNASFEVFRHTLDEIRRILHVYETKLGSPGGRDSLYGNPLTTYFLSQRSMPSDVRMIIATLEQDVRSLGIAIRARPTHVAKYTLDEQALASRLGAQDENDPDDRVWHDVKCVAAILTWREGFETDQIESSKAVFVTSTGLVVKNVREWWLEQRMLQPGSTEATWLVPPVVHQIALSNYAWLKQPLASKDLKLNELIATCYAALQPSQDTWSRFIRHLRKLKDGEKVTSDEVAALMASQLTRDALVDAEDEGDIDAEAIEEVIERVESKYGAEAAVALEQADRAEESRLAVENRVRSKAAFLSSWITNIVFGLAAVLIAGLVVHSIFGSSFVVRSLLAILTFVGIVFGFFVFQRKPEFQEWLTQALCAWFHR